MKTNSLSNLDSSLKDLGKEALLARLLDLEIDLTSSEEKNLILEAKVTELTAYLRQARQHRFGRSSEKSFSSKSPFFPGMEQAFDEAGEESKDTTDKEKKKKKKRKAQGGRKPLPKELPREEIIYDLSENEKTCSCGNPLHCIGRDVSEQLEVIPAKVKVLQHVRLKYGCKACEEKVFTAPQAPQPIPKSMAGPGLLSHILVSKYDDHLPLYRQAEIWERSGIDLDRATLSRWVMKCGKLLSPLVDLMHKDIVSSNYIQADETTVQVMGEKGRANTSKSYMWAYKTEGDEKFKIIYKYAPERSACVGSKALEGFKGYLQSDGYSGYTKICNDSEGEVEGLGCWAHARRKFTDIDKISTKRGVAAEAIDKIAGLYGVEKEARESKLTFDEIKALREKKSKPLLENLKTFLEEKQRRVLPRSSLGKAINYSLGNWKELNVYLKEGSLSIDNNPIERCIRPFAIGRKNWLFKGSVGGAEASAVIYSLLETAKSYDHNPFHYFEDILKKIPAQEKLENLLPYRWKSPEDKP